MTNFATGCDPRCWEADNENCSCICGGINHGISHRDLKPGEKSVTPKRIIKKGGVFWELQVIGSYFDWLHQRDNGLNIFRQTRNEIEANDPGASTDIKNITKAQWNWPEVVEWRSNQRIAIPNGAVGDYQPMALYKLIRTN